LYPDVRYRYLRTKLVYQRSYTALQGPRSILSSPRKPEISSTPELQSYCSRTQATKAAQLFHRVLFAAWIQIQYLQRGAVKKTMTEVTYMCRSKKEEVVAYFVCISYVIVYFFFIAPWYLHVQHNFYVFSVLPSRSCFLSGRRCPFRAGPTPLGARRSSSSCSWQGPSRFWCLCCRPLS
jgi:hypothetical protein